MADRSLSRRDVLATVGAGMAAGIASAADPATPHRIDIHYHHIAPDWIAEPAVRQTMAPQVVQRALDWTPARALEEMDRNQVETALCSVSNPGVWFGDLSQGRRLARACNDYAAAMARDHRRRFGLFAALPLPDTEGSLAEIRHAMDELDADGVGLFTSYGDKWLADPAFAQVFQELNRRRAVVYVHPMAPTCCRSLMPGIPAALIEYPIDSTRTILQWMMTGASTLYPDLRMIFSHAGGLMMSGIGRLQILAETQPAMRLPNDFAAEAAKLYYEISSSADAVTMAALRAYVPTSHILLGTDSPFIGPMAPNIARLQGLGLSPQDLSAIERGNALALLGRTHR